MKFVVYYTVNFKCLLCSILYFIKRFKEIFIAVEIYTIMKYNFLLVTTASQTGRNINILFCSRVTMSTHWFAKFRTGKFEFDLINKSRGRPESKNNYRSLLSRIHYRVP